VRGTLNNHQNRLGHLNYGQQRTVFLFNTLLDNDAIVERPMRSGRLTGLLWAGREATAGSIHTVSAISQPAKMSRRKIVNSPVDVSIGHTSAASLPAATSADAQPWR
jgi:hypothetical protein